MKLVFSSLTPDGAVALDGHAAFFGHLHHVDKWRQLLGFRWVLLGEMVGAGGGLVPGNDREMEGAQASPVQDVYNIFDKKR